MEPEEIPWIVGVLQARMRAYVMRRYGLEKVSRLFVRAPLPENVREIEVDNRVVAVVTMTDEMLRSAREDAEWRQRSAVKAGLRETFARRDIDWELDSVLGEYAAAQYLYASWRRAHDQIREGLGIGDFTFEGRTYDVKTARQIWHQYLAVPVGKFLKFKDQIHFYVGAQVLSEREVAIHGFADAEEVAHAEVKNLGLHPAHCIPFHLLHPMHLVASPGVRDPETGRGMPWQPSILKYIVSVSPPKRREVAPARKRSRRHRTRTRKRKMVNEQQLQLDEAQQPRR